MSEPGGLQQNLFGTPARSEQSDLPDHYNTRIELGCSDVLSSGEGISAVRTPFPLGKWRLNNYWKAKHLSNLTIVKL